MELLFKRYTLVSGLEPEELIFRLQEQLGKRPLFFRRITKPYWGKVHGHSFKIEPSVISRRNGTTVIKGDILSTNTGSIVQLLMRVPIITFMTMAVIITGSVFLLFLFGTNGTGIAVFLFSIFIIFPLVVYLASVQIFKYQVKLSKAFLLNLFEAEEVH